MLSRSCRVLLVVALFENTKAAADEGPRLLIFSFAVCVSDSVLVLRGLPLMD
jgi:hypothetical protein